jgi:uncharacterized coiled-coil protein SlyX
MNDRMNQLESTVAQQDRTMQQLHGELYRQQQDIASLNRRIEILEGRLEAMDRTEGIAEGERPPHW